MPIEFFKAYVAYVKVTQPNSIDFDKDNEKCVKSTFNRLYWTAIDMIENEDDEDKSGLYLFLGVAIGAVFVIAILLLVIYFKRRNTEEEESEETTKGAEKLTA